LRRKNGESISDFTKRFDKMYNKMLDEINLTETSSKITFANTFDVKGEKVHHFSIYARGSPKG